MLGVSVLLLLVEGGTLEQRVEVHLMGIKIRAVHAGKFGLAADMGTLCPKRCCR